MLKSISDYLLLRRGQTVFTTWRRCFVLSVYLIFWNPAKEGKSGEYEFKNTGIEVGGVPEANLIVKAYRLLAEEYSLPAVYIHLHKVIPFGAGLGGGSSDAAFMLKALNEYFELNLSQEKMME